MCASAVSETGGAAPWTLRARLASGQVLEVKDVRPSDKISAVRTRLASDLKLHLSSVKLISGPRILSDEASANEVGNAEISVVLEPWPPSWYPPGKYQFDGRDVLKIVTEKFFIKGLGDFMRHRIEFVDGCVKQSDIHDHAYIESLINEFGFERHSVERGWLRSGYHGHVVEAVPKEDSAEWELHGSVERRKIYGSSHGVCNPPLHAMDAPSSTSDSKGDIHCSRQGAAKRRGFVKKRSSNNHG